MRNLIKEFKSLSLIDTLYKHLTFHDLFIATLPCAQKIAIRRSRKMQDRTVQACRQKSEITVVLFLQSPSIWKYDNLYWLFKRSKWFKPVVVVSPYNVHLVYDRNECMSVMKTAMEFAQSKGYDCVCSYDSENNCWIDVRKMYNPDIVFFTKPYKDTLPAYHIYNFKDKLTLYAPYGFTCIDIFRTNYNLPFNNLLWRMMLETEYQKDYYKTYSLCRGSNGVVSGSFGTEQLIDPRYSAKDVWKPQDRPKKRIIWAPHHTVDYLFNFSNFLVYCDVMLEIADRYRDTVQFAFKPHPVLKFKLINIWGKERTEEYYRRWETGGNTQLETGYYIDLFLTSDAMIHDCASFTAEYLYTRKPVLFMVRDGNVESHWNSFGKKCFDVHYHASNRSEVESFINNVVIGGNDTMRPLREEFFENYLCPEDGVLPSEWIYRYLCDILDKQ